MARQIYFPQLSSRGLLVFQRFEIRAIHGAISLTKVREEGFGTKWTFGTLTSSKVAVDSAAAVQAWFEWWAIVAPRELEVATGAQEIWFRAAAAEMIFIFRSSECVIFGWLWLGKVGFKFVGFRIVALGLWTWLSISVMFLVMSPIASLLFFEEH